MILGFPCGQFLGQELKTGLEASQFCTRSYGVTFPMMKKISVNGRDCDPIFTFLKRSAPGVLGNWIKWNFTKFLISRDGQVILRFAPITRPEALEPAIKRFLAAPQDL